ncbi:transglutaminase domain-containing protein [Paraflavitalea pollutisoli]|uniref:transglutaminase domain-containing protein n=1 Tax=Paraflavitalea pollutisoli TaxID=3034143 RepID=UPI0023ED6123|nr:transglutaminase domain-containing protein [Paraflavitalea sp. H1-2-19X]
MKRFVVMTLLLVVVFSFNYITRTRLPLAYADLADYSLLYTTEDGLYVKKLWLEHDSIAMQVNGVADKQDYSIVTLGAHGERSEPVTYRGTTLRYKPEAGKPRVMVTVNNQDSFRLQLSTSFPDTSEPIDATVSQDFEISSPDIMIEPASIRSMDDWAASAWWKTERVTPAQVQQVLRDSIHIQGQDNSEQRIIKIAAFILARTRGKGPRPAAFMTSLHPLEQLREVQNNRSGLWCGNYTAMFSSLATIAGIPVRTVGTGGEWSGVGKGVHMFCEAYIREKKCWAYVDLLANTMLISQQGRYLNVLDVHRLLPFQLPDSAISAYTYQNDSVVLRPFNTLREIPALYFTPNTVFTFYYDRYFRMYPANGWSSRIANFFSMAPYYALYSDNMSVVKTNYEFYMRLVSNGLLVAAALIWSVYLLLWFRKGRRRQ